MSGWGRAAEAVCEAVRPERFAEAEAAFQSAPGARGLCLFGGGRSYGDCALNDGGAALITTRLDRVLAFDAESGIAQVEPGVTFARLLKVFLPRGFLVPVTPGTSFATVGGAVANDVHGKNHERDGSFGQHVTEIDLLLPDGSQRTITPDDTELFRATVAGLGLTGFMTRIAFRMQRVIGPAVAVRERRVADLDAFLDAMAEAAGAPGGRSSGFSGVCAESAQRGGIQCGLCPPCAARGAHAHGAFGEIPVSARYDTRLEPDLRQARVLSVSMRGAV
jgi:decaprenylphospho-beta-D-ribofuranose 2-oxidase